MNIIPKNARRLVDDALVGGWPQEWVTIIQTDDLCRITISDEDSGDCWWACWLRCRNGRWKFVQAHDGWQEMSLTSLRSFVCNGPVEVTA